MFPIRRRCSALVTAALSATLLAACTSGTGTPGTRETGQAATSGHTPARPAVPSTSSAAPAAESVLNCGSFIGNSTQPAPFRVVLGVVALPASPGYQALATSLSGDGPGAPRLFAKTGLLIRSGTTFELTVPARFTSQLSIGWGTPGPPSHRVLVHNCAGPGGGWLAYAGGYWINHPACVPLTVTVGGRQQQVHIGVGTACPGQQPPSGPSEH